MAPLGTESLHLSCRHDALLGELLAQADDLIAVVDPHLRLLAASDSFRRVLQPFAPASLLVGDLLPDLLAAAPFADCYLDAWRRAAAGEAAALTLAWGADDDPAPSYEIAFHPWTGPEGELRGAFHIARQISEHHLAERSGAEWAARLRAIVDTAVDGILTYDACGTIESVNPAAERIFGYTAQEMLGQNLHLLMPQALASIDGGPPVFDPPTVGRGREARGRRKGGAEFPLELAVSEMRLADRRLFTAILRDVSDRSRAHAALRLANQQTERSLAQLQAVIGHMTEGVVVADPTGMLLDMNPAALAMHRVDDVAKIRRPLAELKQYFKLYELDGRQLSEAEWPLSRALRGESFAALEMRVVHTRSKYEWIASYGGTAVRDKEGRIQLALLTVRDVTAQKAAEEELRQLNEFLELRVAERTALLKTRNEQLRVLAAKLTSAEHQERRRIAQLLHDHFQQLLVAAKIGVDQIRKNTPDARLQAVVRNVNEIIDQSIHASRTLAVELCPPVLYDRGLAAALEWLGRQFQEQHDLRVALTLHAAAEPASADVQAFLLQAVRELLLNIVKHAHAHEARVAMRSLPEGQVAITVEDDGPGFEPQAALAPADGEHGFGLFSIQQRLGLLGGKFEIHTAPGAGCRVTLIAPCETPGDENALPAAVDDLTQTTAAARRRGAATRTIRLLLVDDHKIMRQGLAHLLRSERDIELVGEAGDGQEALDLVRQLRPEVVVMDVSMPRMDGIRATQHIKQSHPQTRIIGLSMHERDDMAHAMLEAGATTYLTKGGPSEKLVAAIRGE